jgi:hypothetical protein
VTDAREQRAVGGGSVQLCWDEGGRERPPLIGRWLRAPKATFVYSVR